MIFLILHLPFKIIFPSFFRRECNMMGDFNSSGSRVSDNGGRVVMILTFFSL